MAFKDLTLPDCYNLDIRVTRQLRSEDVTALSGDIYPNPKWAYSRRQFRISWGPKKLGDVDTFLAFWEVVKTEHTFRLRDPQDFRSAAHGSLISDQDQLIGVGDGVETQFQLVKRYSYEGETYDHPIFAPVPGSIVVSVDGVAQSTPADFSVDTATGLVTFTTAPANTHLIRAGYAYDIKVRFEDASLIERFRARHLGEIDTFTLIENPR